MSSKTKRGPGIVAEPENGRMRALKAELEEVRRGSRLKDQYLSIATHELSAPLTAMKAYIETLVEHYDEPTFTQGREFLEVLQQETGRLIRIVDRTLEISRLTCRQAPLRHERVLLHEIAAEVARSLAPLLAERLIRLEVHIPPGVPAVAGDGDLLKQVLMNLIHNAIKFSPSGCPIQVRAVPCADVVEIEVRDYGFGIAAEEVGRIFEPYFRSGDGRVARERGTGLGLMIVKTIVEQHGGRITVDSQPDHGTTFRFTIPVA